jgi:hypothetical protein
MKKRAQGLSMTTIVVAALALLVLVVLALVFTGRMGEFTTGIKDIGTCDQACTAAGFEGEGDSCLADGSYLIAGFEEDCCCKSKT